MKDVKDMLIASKKTFDVALLANNDEAVINNYILGVCNTLATNPSLLKCTPQSIRDAAITSATLGVPLDARKYAYLVPYGDKAQFQLSYKGFVDIAKRDRDVDNIQSIIVYQEDTFSLDIGANTVSHMPNLDAPSYGNDSAIKFFYAVVRFRANTGRAPIFEVMSKKQIDEIRANSNAGGEKDKWGNPTIWAKYYSEMGRKTVIKRLCKHAQLGDTARFDEIDNAIEQNKIININPDGVVESEDLLQKDRDKILEAIAACQTDEEVKNIGGTHFEKLEEINCYNMTFAKEISVAMGKKEDELYIERMEETFAGCEDVESLDKVYEAHKVRIARLKAKDRNAVEQVYCDCKEELLTNSLPE